LLGVTLSGSKGHRRLGAGVRLGGAGRYCTITLLMMATG
jgi:hypothetical protein